MTLVFKEHLRLHRLVAMFCLRYTHLHLIDLKIQLAKVSLLLLMVLNILELRLLERKAFNFMHEFGLFVAEELLNVT